MERTYDTEQTASSEQTDTKFYLPGTTTMSNEPGVVERFLKTLFRRRGGYRIIVRRSSR
ncbi:MAG: hypothetical protein ACI8XM_002453 [Haloarculaceae archaeon]|jgi:hypothetical protein